MPTCASITRPLGPGGTVTVTADEIAGNSMPGGDCCAITLGISRSSGGYADSIIFTQADVATSPHMIYAEVAQSDGQIAYCTGSVAVTSGDLPGDFDGDTDVDQADFGRFQLCLSGSGNTHEGGECGRADLDGDGDVDADDTIDFRGCMSGANVPANPACVP